MAGKTRIGEVIESFWDDEGKCIRFTIEIDKSRRKVAGRLNSGFDRVLPLHGGMTPRMAE